MAPGKINFYLDVLNKREDGYHNIRSVMQSVSLCDTLTLEISDKHKCDIVITCSDHSIKCDGSNLVYKAAKLFTERLGIMSGHLHFHIEKNIPIAAGMAGGSADAAAALRLLNSAYGSPYTPAELCNMGSLIGADVPFCILGGTRICEGIGEELSALPTFSGIDILCAIDSSSVSTPKAFGMLDEKYGTDCKDSADISKMTDAIAKRDKDLLCSALYNKFEDVIIPVNPNITLIKNTLLECGAVGALMSGSGPSVFGIFDSEDDAVLASEKLKKMGIRAYPCKTI